MRKKSASRAPARERVLKAIRAALKLHVNSPSQQKLNIRRVRKAWAMLSLWDLYWLMLHSLVVQRVILDIEARVSRKQKNILKKYLRAISSKAARQLLFDTKPLNMSHWKCAPAHFEHLMCKSSPGGSDSLSWQHLAAIYFLVSELNPDPRTQT